MNKLILFSFLFIFISCKKDKIENIKIGITLLQNQTLEENKRLDTIIKMTLKGDYNSLRRLNHFPCGDGAGCYDKGFIITQIIYKLGEKDFNKMVDKLDRKELYGLEEYLKVGLEYGDNNNDGKIDNKIAEKEFPILINKLRKK